jgi:hypothetical protein
MVALGRFIARSGEKALPFFKLMKRTGKFEWTSKADKAFAELKRYLTSPPIMVALMFCEPLLLYIVATPRTASAVLVAERDAKVIAKERIDPPCPGLLLRKKQQFLLSLKRSRQLQLRRPSRSHKATLLNSMRINLLRTPPRCGSPCTSSARYYATHGSATPCSKSCSTPR